LIIDRQLASVPKTIEVVKIIVPTRTVFNLNNSNTLLIRMYKRLFCFATRQLIGLFTIEVTTEHKVGFKNKREMSLGLSSHRCSPNWYTAPILMNDSIVPR